MSAGVAVQILSSDREPGLGALERGQVIIHDARGSYAGVGTSDIRSACRTCHASKTPRRFGSPGAVEQHVAPPLIGLDLECLPDRFSGTTAVVVLPPLIDLRVLQEPPRLLQLSAPGKVCFLFEGTGDVLPQTFPNVRPTWIQALLLVREPDDFVTMGFCSDALFFGLCKESLLTITHATALAVMPVSSGWFIPASICAGNHLCANRVFRTPSRPGSSFSWGRHQRRPQLEIFS